jgi:hypothetical protein
MVNDNTPSPKRRRKRKVEKPRITPKKIRDMKAIVRFNRRALRSAVPQMKPVLWRLITQLEGWIKAYES